MIPESYTFSYPWLDTRTSVSVSCCLCGGKSKTKEVFTFTVNGVDFTIRHCLEDDLMYLSPQPSGMYTDTLYNHPSYFTGEDDMYGLYVSEEKSTEVAQFRITEIMDYFQKNNLLFQNSSMLEIGCAYGHTLAEGRRKGLSITDGIEFSSDAVEKCNEKEGLYVQVGSVDYEFGDLLKHSSYNIITMYSVLEHVRNPITFLNQIRPFLATNGIVVIRVPIMSPGGPWLSLIDHFWHFSKKSLQKLLSDAGFVTEDIFESGTFIGTQHPGKLTSMTAIARQK